MCNTRPMRAIVVVIGLGLFAAEAGAQPAVADPPAQGYPSSLAARPLLLPQAVYELSAEMRIYSYDNYGVDFGDRVLTDLHARAGVGWAEVFAEANLLIVEPKDGGSAETLEWIGAGALVPFGPGGGLLVKGGLFGPTSDYKVVDTHAAYLFRKQTATGVAVQGGGGVGFSRYMPSGGDGNHNVNAEAQLGGQVQLQPTLAIDVGFRATIPIFSSWEETNHSIATELTGRLVYTTTGFDVYGGLGINTGFGDVKTVLVGVAGRLQ